MKLITFRIRISGSLEIFRFREALAEMMNLARLGNKYLTDAEPWKIFKTDPERVKTILNISLQICANLAVVSAPFLPFTSEKLFAMLNIEPLDWNEGGRADILKAGHQLNKPEYLFEKIEDDVIEAQVQKLLDTRKENEGEQKAFTPQKDSIVYDDFMKLDIRVGKVLEAERVPKTDKLLKLTVDTGLDKRTVVSGIAEFYKPEDLVGKNFCFIMNLEPRKLRGIESQGMILSAEDRDGKLSLITPDRLFETGSEIR